MIYIVEGPDGVGKTTLANAIAEKVKGHVLHSTYQKGWDIKAYHESIIANAKLLNEYQDVIIDRWAPSEWVYGNVFRNGASYDVHIMCEAINGMYDVKWIICKNPNAVINHIVNKKIRPEMFGDMTDVVANFSIFVSDTPSLNWLEYDYTKNDIKEFVEEVTND